MSILPLVQILRHSRIGPLGLGGCVVLFLMMVPMLSVAKEQQGRWIQRCASDTPAHYTAVEILKKLDAQVETLGRPTSLNQVRTSFQALMKHACFEMARMESSIVPKVRSILSFRTWWADGGHTWLGSYLYPPRAYVTRGGKPRPAHWVILPPHERIVLTRADRPKHPLASILCHQDGYFCGGKAQGWRVRADRALRHLQVERDRKRQMHNPDGSRTRHFRTCAAKTQSRDPSTRYLSWRYCVEDVGILRSTVPLGVGAPEEGWLMVLDHQVRHSGHCAKMRLYNLETGAAYVYGGCDSSTCDARDPASACGKTKKRRYAVGEAAVDNVQEALWMLLILEHLESTVRTQSERIPLPAHIQPRWKDKGTAFGVGRRGFGSGGSSHYPQLDWHWVKGNTLMASGHIKRDSFESDAELHGLNLLEIAEKSRRSACPGPAPLGQLGLAEAISANRTLIKEFTAAYTKWRDESDCSDGGPN